MAKQRELTERGREMQRLLEQAERGNLSLAEFSRQRGLHPNTLAWWRSRLRGTREASREKQTRFVEVALPGGSGGFGKGTPCLYEIVMPEGTVVRVPEGFEAETLERLLRVVREPC